MVQSPSRGQVYTYDDPYHDGGKRPIMVMSAKRANGGDTLLVAPFSSSNLDSKRRYPWNLLFAQGECGLKHESVLCLNNLMTMSKSKIHWSNRLQDATPARLKEIDALLKIVLAIECCQPAPSSK